jgi:hypothetical protein
MVFTFTYDAILNIYVQNAYLTDESKSLGEIPNHRTAGQEGHEFKASLGYIEMSRLAWAT